MNKILKRVSLGAAVLLLVAAAVQPAQAACASGGLLLTTESASAASQIMTDEFFAGASASPLGYPGSWYSYAGPPVDLGSLSGVWWAAGIGDPLPGAGNDNGLFDVANWIDFYSADPYGTGAFYYGATLTTSWASSPDIDGCINNSASGCTCILLTQNAPGQNPKFLLMGSTGFFNLPGNAPLLLADIPKPFIASSSRDAITFDLSMGVQVPLPAAGIYQQDGCDCALAFRPREIVLPRGAQPPADRDSDLWVPLGPPVAAVDTAAVVSGCGSTTDNTDVYLATELVGDPVSGGGFGAPYVSDLATRIECGPNLADPEPFKKGRVKATNPDRGNRSGR